MTTDLLRQLEDYAAHFEAGLADFAVDDVVGSGVDQVESPRRRFRPSLAIAAAVLVTAVSVGVPLFLLRRQPGSGVVGDPGATTTIPATTTVTPTTIDASPITWVEPVWERVLDVGLADEGMEYMEAITTGGPGFVAVGSDCGTGLCEPPGSHYETDDWDAAVWVSVDGSTWQRVPHDEEALGGPGSQDMLDVVEAGPGLVAVGIVDHAYWGGRRAPWEVRPGEGPLGSLPGYRHEEGRDDIDAAVWVSEDGITWERVGDPNAVFSGPAYGSAPEAGDQGMEAVAVGKGLIVAVGSAHEDAAVWVSTDGYDWQRIPHDDAVFGGMSGQWMHDVTFTGERFIAVGTDLACPECIDRFAPQAAVWTSEDGITWSRVPRDPEVFGAGPDGFAMLTMWSVTATDTGYVAAGMSDSRMPLWFSEDGTEWTRVQDPDAPFAYPSPTVYWNESRLFHEPVKALAATPDGIIAASWDRESTDVTGPGDGMERTGFEHDWHWGHILPVIARTDVIVAGDTAIAVGYADGDAAVWVADLGG
ncbi:MAG TPA: hypothetical protein VLD62_12035 [Acidimicrobiia bacterium]|nr:hypothetical protein [Acidimicrobiia bacterium]